MRTLPALVALALFSVSLPALADGPGFAIGVGGIEVPGTVSVLGAQAALVWPTPDEKRDLRAGLLLWSSTDDYTAGKGGLLFLEQNLWWGVYGLGYGAGVGQASSDTLKYDCSTKTCVSNGKCKADGLSCSSSGDCCSSPCKGGVCRDCAPSGSSCSGDSDGCSSMKCDYGTCKSCKGYGTHCSSSSDCCGSYSCESLDGGTWHECR